MFLPCILSYVVSTRYVFGQYFFVTYNTFVFDLRPLSFHPRNFVSRIKHALEDIFYWMSPNRLTFNSSTVIKFTFFSLG